VTCRFQILPGRGCEWTFCVDKTLIGRVWRDVPKYEEVLLINSAQTKWILRSERNFIRTKLWLLLTLVLLANSWESLKSNTISCIYCVWMHHSGCLPLLLWSCSFLAQMSISDADMQAVPAPLCVVSNNNFRKHCNYVSFHVFRIKTRPTPEKLQFRNPLYRSLVMWGNDEFLGISKCCNSGGTSQFLWICIGIAFWLSLSSHSQLEMWRLLLCILLKSLKCIRLTDPL
jgi:hypothetical protein